MNKLDTTFRATDTRNKRVIEWISVEDIPAPSLVKVLFTNGKNIYEGMYNAEADAFMTINMLSSIPTPSHWASLPTPPTEYVEKRDE